MGEVIYGHEDRFRRREGAEITERRIADRERKAAAAKRNQELADSYRKPKPTDPNGPRRA